MIKRMLLREVEYARPGSIEEAVRLLGAHDGARALAGGQTLVNVMKARAASPEVLVDLAALDELRAIGRSADGSLELGAMVTYSELIGSPEVAAARPILAEIAATIADRQVQNRGTVGGNVCVNDPTNHLPPLLSAVGATFTILGADGERTVTSDDFFLGVYMTAAGEGDLLTRISVPVATPGTGDAMEGVTLGVHGTYIVSAAATVGPGGVRVAIGCVSGVPERATTLEGRLAGAELTPEAVHSAIAGIGVELDPPGDVHAPAEYRRRLAEICCERAVLSAAKRARG
jgi:carbon-monoxide dehydrogenase medium subunit